MKRLQRTLARRRAQSLVELALTLPLLMLLLLALIEFGLLLYAHVQVANAARESARAASLYRSTRYLNIGNYTNPTDCASGIDGWSLEQAAQQGVVYRALNNQGCPNTSGTIVASSLGRLDPQPASPAWSLAVADSAFLPQNGTTMPVPGTRATVKLTYPYRLLIISALVPALTDPIMIEKSVEFEYQQ